MIAVATDAILVLVILEAVALVLYHRRTGRGIAPSRLLGNLAAGFCLVLAVRLALAGTSRTLGGEAAIGAALFAALIAHLVDLASRWRA